MEQGRFVGVIEEFSDFIENIVRQLLGGSEWHHDEFQSRIIEGCFLIPVNFPVGA